MPVVVDARKTSSRHAIGLTSNFKKPFGTCLSTEEKRLSRTLDWLSISSHCWEQQQTLRRSYLRFFFLMGCLHHILTKSTQPLPPTVIDRIATLPTGAPSKAQPGNSN